MRISLKRFLVVKLKPWEADYEFQISGIALNHNGAAM